MQPQHDQVDQPMERAEQQLQIMPPLSPPPDEEWTWRPEFEVTAPEPNGDERDEPMGEPQEPPRRRATRKRPPTADEQEEQQKRARRENDFFDIPIQ